MTRWRQGQSIPHHVYAQRGDEPDTRPWPDGDPPVATFLDPEAAEIAVRAVNLARARMSEKERDRLGYRDGFHDGARYARDHDAMTARLSTEYRHDDCATCGTKADPVILQHPAGYTLAEQVQAVWDEEGPDGVADAIRRVARGERT